MKQKGWKLNHIGSLAGVALAALAGFTPIANAQQSQGVTRDLGGEGQWAITDEPDLTSIEGQLHRARRSLAEGRLSESRSRATQFIEAYPDHVLAAEAYLVRGDALNLAHEYYRALFDYEFIARMFPSSEVFYLALEREYDIALLFSKGTKRKLWGFRCLSAHIEAEELLIRIQERLPGSKLAEKAGRALADMYYDRREMDSASTAYDLYLVNHPDAADNADAMERLVGANLATYKGPKFNLRGLDEARVWLTTMEERFPAKAQQIRSSAIKDRIEEAHAERMLVDARWYLKQRDEVSAEFILNRLLKKYSSTVSAGKAYQIMLDHGWINPPAAPVETGDTAGINEPLLDVDDVEPIGEEVGEEEGGGKQ